MGAREREKYAALNESMLQSLGNIVFSDEQSQTYVLQVAFFGAVGYNKKDTKYAVHPTGRISG